jgi:hypothetical protein
METLVKTNLGSMLTLLDEMKKEKEGRKSAGLFNSSVLFDETTMIFTPDEREITDALLSVIRDMIKVVVSTTRILDHSNFD